MCKISDPISDPISDLTSDPIPSLTRIALRSAQFLFFPLLWFSLAHASVHGSPSPPQPTQQPTASATLTTPAAIEATVSVIEEVQPDFDLRCTLVLKDTKQIPSAIIPTSILLGYKPDAPTAGHLKLTFSAKSLILSRLEKGKRAKGKATSTLAEVRQYYALPSSAEGTRVVVQWRNGSLRVIYDGRTLLRHSGLGALAGTIALVGTGAKAGSVALTTPKENKKAKNDAGYPGYLSLSDPLLQPVEPTYFADDFMRSSADQTLWEASSGAWKLNTAPDPMRVSNAFSYTGAGKAAVAVTGHWFWSDYTVAASVRPMGAGAIGLVALWQDADNHFVFKWRAQGDEYWRGREKQLWRVLHGKATLVAIAPGGYHSRQWHRLSLETINGGLRAVIDGKAVLQVRSDLFGQGKAGLFCDGEAGAAFDDVVIYDSNDQEAIALAQAATRDLVVPQFSLEQTMEDWASPRSEWVPATNVPAGMTGFWHRGAFWNDYAIAVKAKGLAADSRVMVALCSDGESPASGYALQVSARVLANTNEAHLEVILLRDGKPVGIPKNVPLPSALAASCPLKLERKGNIVRGFVADKMIVSFDDRQPLRGSRAGFMTQVAQIAASEASVVGGNVLDYTFYRAPTEWQVGSGTWEVASRWMCSPQWGWYGGWSERVAAVWNKRSFAGDMVIEVFAACKMDSPTPPHYLHPRDINVTIAGDGRDPASGYSFIFGGWNNTFTRILRGTQSVAETKDTLLPVPYNGVGHRKWFGLRIEKIGDTVSFYVDRKLALRYRDPKPLDGRRIALWTCGNGVMIARTTIYYEKEGYDQKEADAAESSPLGAFASLKPLPVKNGRLGWQVRKGDTTVLLGAVADGEGEVLKENKAKESAGNQRPEKAVRPVVRAINGEGGGPFAIAPQMEPFDVFKSSKLSFSCRLMRGTEINLYLSVKGIQHSVRLTGPASDAEAEGVKSIGVAPAVRADGKWHTVEIDLAALLKPLYPGEPTLLVNEIFFGNLTRDLYHQAGFGVNAPGASYLVRDFTLRAPDGRVVKLVEPELQVPALTKTISKDAAIKPSLPSPARALR